MHRPFLKAGYVGLAVIAMSILLLMIFPSRASKMPDGFITPLIAFEFIKTPAEVFQLFVSTNGTVQRDMVSAMDFGNRLDFVYMVLYSAFLLVFSVRCAQLSSKKIYYLGAVIAAVVLAADIMENIQLLGITASIDSGDFEPYLLRLHLFTWIKWGGIAAIFLVLFFWFARGGMFSKIIGMGGLVSSGTGVLAYFNRSVLNEIFSLTVAGMFLLMIMYCFVYKSNEAD